MCRPFASALGFDSLKRAPREMLDGPQAVAVLRAEDEHHNYESGGLRRWACSMSQAGTVAGAEATCQCKGSAPHVAWALRSQGGFPQGERAQRDTGQQWHTCKR